MQSGSFASGKVGVDLPKTGVPIINIASGNRCFPSGTDGRLYRYILPVPNPIVAPVTHEHAQ